MPARSAWRTTGLGDAAHRVAAGVALGQEPEDDARVAGRDRVLEHVEGQQLEPGEALLAAEAGEVAVVLDEAGEGGPGEEGVELGLGHPLDARDLGGRHAGGEPHAEPEAGAVGQGAGAARGGGHGGGRYHDPRIGIKGAAAAQPTVGRASASVARPDQNLRPQTR